MEEARSHMRMEKPRSAEPLETSGRKVIRCACLAGSRRTWSPFTFCACMRYPAAGAAMDCAGVCINMEGS